MKDWKIVPLTNTLMSVTEPDGHQYTIDWHEVDDSYWRLLVACANYESHLFQVLVETTERTTRTLLIFAPSHKLASDRALTRYPGIEKVLSANRVDPGEETIFVLRGITQRVRIEITDNANNEYWYKDKIGKQYDGILVFDYVKDHNIVIDLLSVLDNKPAPGAVYLSHCKIVSVERY